MAKELGVKLTAGDITTPVERTDPLVDDARRANFRTEELIKEVISAEDLQSKDQHSFEDHVKEAN